MKKPSIKACELFNQAIDLNKKAIESGCKMAMNKGYTKLNNNIKNDIQMLIDSYVKNVSQVNTFGNIDRQTQRRIKELSFINTVIDWLNVHFESNVFNKVDVK